MGCDVSMVRAVDAVESAGRGYLPSGKPKILFEGHLFHKHTNGKFDRSHPTISYAVWTKSHYKGGEAEYSRLEEAYKLDPIAALRSTSWQRFQILGDNYAMCGYSSVESFVEAMFQSEDNSLEAFTLYIMHRGLRDAMRRHDADAVAYGYNGASYRRNQYGVRIHNADEKFSRIKIDCRALASTAPTPIDAVIPTDCHQECVGLNNTSLDDRYTDPTPEKAETEDGAKPLKTTSNPTYQTPPDGSQSPQDLAGEHQADTSSETPGGDASKPSPSERFNTWLGRATDWQGKLDQVRGLFDEIRQIRPASLKSLATYVLHHAVQVVVFLFSWFLGVPLKYWAVLATLLAVVALVYMFRQFVREFTSSHASPTV